MVKGRYNKLFREQKEKFIHKWLESGKSKEDLIKHLESDKYHDAIMKSFDSIVDILVVDIEKNMHKKIEINKKIDDEFVKGNEKIWCDAFVAFDSMYWICLEMTKEYVEFVHSLPDEEMKDKQYTFLVLQFLHGRALQVFLEIYCLMKNGFADGAYARWRSLYELSIIASFIDISGEEVALAFIKQQNKAKDNYEWAKKANVFKGYDRISFKKIRNIVEKTSHNWEHQYSLGNKVIHATSHGTFMRLAGDESENGVHIGRSYRGMSTPGEHSAIMLSWITNVFLLMYPTEDTIINGLFMQKWVTIVQKHFLTIAVEKCERTDLADALKEIEAKMQSYK